MDTPVCGHCGSPTFVVKSASCNKWFCEICMEEVWVDMPTFTSKVLPFRFPVEEVPRDRAWVVPILMILAVAGWASLAVVLLS